MTTVRTRFAPSPTGFLHVGGARTALYSWLYAKHFSGQFILRVEDTDLERSTPESVQAILDGMEWLGLDYDEGPFYQTQRMTRYQEVIQTLLEQGDAYRCACSKQRLEDLREAQKQAKEKPRYDGKCRDANIPADAGDFVIRFKNPQSGAVAFADKVYGDIVVQNTELDDLIIARTDGTPTYNLTVVVDDWDMQITHVIRGDDHINNTPRQINILSALGAPVPEYAHLPMILGDDGKRLSKRHGAVSVLQYREDGFLPEALLNYLVRLGWSHGDQEIFSLQEMIDNFTLKAVSRSGASFNTEKLLWLNQHYMKARPVAQLCELLQEFLTKMGVEADTDKKLESVVELQLDRSKTLLEMAEKSLYFFTEVALDEAAAKKHLRPVAKAPLEYVLTKLRALNPWSAESISACVEETLGHFEIKLGKLAQPLRVAITGNSMSPSIADTMLWIGQDQVIQRIEQAITYIDNRTQE